MLQYGSVSAATSSGQTGLPKSIASRCYVNQQNGGIVSSVAGETLRQDHKCLATCDDLRLAFSNSYGGGRTVAANTIYVRAGIEDAAGVAHRVTFNGGLTEVTLVPGATIFSDPVGIGFSNGERIRTRTFVRVANAGELVPNGATTRTSPYVDGVAAADQTVAASPTWTTDGAYHFGPSGLFADFTDATCVVAIYGDSVAAGQNDGNANVDQLGWVLRALNDQYPYLNLAIAGDAAIAFRTPVVGGGATSREPRIVLAQSATHAIVTNGANDIGSATLAQLQDAWLRIWKAASMRGQTVIQATILPSGVTSSDAFATLGNQTINVNDSRRTGANDWLRGGAPIDPTTKAPVTVGTVGALVAGASGHPLTSYWEIADAVESSRNSGKWKVSGGVLSDGTHPNATGAALAAAAADLTKLGAVAPGAVAAAPVVDPSTIFGAALFARYQSSAITGKVDGDALSQWNDTSGNSRHMLQATAGKQPLYKTNINYSKPAVRFDGVDDFMQTAGFGTLAQPFEVLIVCKYRTSTHAGVPYMLGGHGGSTFQLRWGAGAAPQFVTIGAGSAVSSSGTSDPGSAWHAWEGLFNGASSALYEDGTSIAAGNAGAGSITALAVAADGNGASLGDIDVQEVLVINRAATTQERSDLHAYLVQTYATP